jgi:photosystem II stability/assembly factor-like uncharacterized protein
VTFDEGDLRRALDERSAAPSPEFRSRLAGVLERGRPGVDRVPALALVATVALALAAIGILVFAHQAHAPKTVPGATSSERLPSPTPTPSPPTGPSPVAGVLATPPKPIPYPVPGFVSAPSSSVVWDLVMDQYLYRSTDRGKTWEQRPLPPAVGLPPVISFISDREGWLLSTGSPETQCNAQVATVWHTTDGGATWQNLGANGIGAPQCKNSLSFVDAMHGYIGAWDDNHGPSIYYTSDGGLTWKVCSEIADPPGFTTKGAGVTLQIGAVRGFGSILLAPATGSQNGAPVEYVYQSADAGASWSYLATASIPEVSIGFVTATRWLQLVDAGRSAETTDAGKTWHVSASQYSQAAPVAAQVVFADDQVGYAIIPSRGDLQITVDGGLHWTDVSVPGR